MKRTAILGILVISALSGTVSLVLAQAPIDWAAPPVSLRAPAELEQLLSPIALYPDPLIAEILPAATQPAQIASADGYVSEGGDINQIDLQPWDGSVKALARYPTVLRWLDENLPWTTELGQAFLYQQPDVMDAIQRLRARALALGNLLSTPQQTVLNENGLIEIVPANPQTVYLPVYQPEVVYAEPPTQPGGFISFGIGLPLGLWLNHDFDWRSHHVVVWHHDHPRPADWWYRRPSERLRDSSPATVWRPHAPSQITERDRESRGWGPAPGRPGSTIGRTEQHPIPERAAAPARDEVRPRTESRVSPRSELPAGPGAIRVEPSVTPHPQSRTEPAPNRAEPRVMPRPAPPRAAITPTPTAAPRTIPSRPTAAATSRPATGALIGVQSAPETHQYSVRGQQSRQAVTQPQPAPARSPAPTQPPTPAHQPASRTPGTPSSSGVKNPR